MYYDRNFDTRFFKGKRALFIVSTGGHYAEANLIKKFYAFSDDSIIITHESSQTTSSLSKVKHYFVPKVGTRDLFNTIRVCGSILSIGKNENFDLIISTGAAIAISSLPLHFLSRKRLVYIESLTRTNKPSLTGRILEIFPSVTKLSSNFGTKRKGWKHLEMPLVTLTPIPKWESKKDLKILVTTGTHSQFNFDRILNLVLAIIEDGDEVTWQFNFKSSLQLPGKICQQLSDQEFLGAITRSDVVITHCGIGNILKFLELGIKTIAIPRIFEMNEHIDNHQVDAFRLFSSQGLIFDSQSSITRIDLEEASRYRIKP